MKNKKNNASAYKIVPNNVLELKTETVAITIRLDAEFRKQIKMWCLKNETTVHETFHKLFNDLLKT